MQKNRQKQKREREKKKKKKKEGRKFLLDLLRLPQEMMKRDNSQQRNIRRDSTHLHATHNLLPLFFFFVLSLSLFFLHKTKAKYLFRTALKCKTAPRSCGAAPPGNRTLKASRPSRTRPAIRAAAAPPLLRAYRSKLPNKRGGRFWPAIHRQSALSPARRAQLLALATVHGEPAGHWTLRDG